LALITRERSLALNIDRSRDDAGEYSKTHSVRRYWLSCTFARRTRLGLAHLLASRGAPTVRKGNGPRVTCEVSSTALAESRVRIMDHPPSQSLAPFDANPSLAKPIHSLRCLTARRPTLTPNGNDTPCPIHQQAEPRSLRATPSGKATPPGRRPHAWRDARVQSRAESMRSARPWLSRCE